MGVAGIVAQGATLAFWGAGAAGDGVGDFGQHLADVEAERPGSPDDLARGVGGQGTGDPGQLRVLDSVEHVVEQHQFPASGELADLSCVLRGQQSRDQ